MNFIIDLFYYFYRENNLYIYASPFYLYTITHALGEFNQIRKVPEYGHSRYLRNHKSYKKIFNEFNLMNKIFIII